MNVRLAVSIPTLSIGSRSERLGPNIGHIGLGVLSTLFPLVVVGIGWELVARAGVFPDVLFPPCGAVNGGSGDHPLSQGDGARRAAVRANRYAHRVVTLLASRGRGGDVVRRRGRAWLAHLRGA